MKKETRERAMNMLRKGVLQGGKHLPMVYVVGNRLFAMEYAAKAWKEEVAPRLPIEKVDIATAFSVELKEFPSDIAVDWSMITNKQ